MPVGGDRARIQFLPDVGETDEVRYANSLLEQGVAMVDLAFAVSSKEMDTRLHAFGARRNRGRRGLGLRARGIVHVTRIAARGTVPRIGRGWTNSLRPWSAGRHRRPGWTREQQQQRKQTKRFTGKAS